MLQVGNRHLESQLDQSPERHLAEAAGKDSRFTPRIGRNVLSAVLCWCWQMVLASSTCCICLAVRAPVVAPQSWDEELHIPVKVSHHRAITA